VDLAWCLVSTKPQLGGSWMPCGASGGTGQLLSDVALAIHEGLFTSIEENSVMSRYGPLSG
jgi:hypothetical protein